MLLLLVNCLHVLQDLSKVQSSPRAPFLAENKLRMVVSWNPDVFINDPQFSSLVELANWIQAEIYSRPSRDTRTSYTNDDSCLLMHVGTLLVWGLFGHMDKNLLAQEEAKRLKRARQSIDASNLASNTVPVLKSMLKEKGLPVSGMLWGSICPVCDTCIVGNKNELVTRLHEDKQNKQQAALSILSLSERFVCGFGIAVLGNIL